MGHIVLTLNLGAGTVPENGQPGVSPFNLSSLGHLPAGAWILGDACTSGTLTSGNCVDVTTATSAALLAEPTSITGAPGPFAASGLSGMFTLALGGFLFWKRQQKRLSVSLMPYASQQ